MKIAMQPIALERENAAIFIGMSVSMLGKLEREGSFPKPRQLSARRVVYLVREIVEWMELRPVSCILPPENTGASKPRLSTNQG